MDSMERVAERQYGLITRAQALHFLTARQVDLRVSRGVWERYGRNVYRVVGSVPDWRQSLLGAVLLAGDEAAASHRAGGQLWEVPGFDGNVVEVSRPRGGSKVARRGILHESLSLERCDLTMRYGIPVTTPARTAFDLFAVVSFKRGARAADTMHARKLVTLEKLSEVHGRLAKRGRPGSAGMRAYLLDRTANGVPESALESLFLAVVADEGEQPRRQASVGGTHAPIGRVDFVFESARLVVEADSQRFHGSWLDIERDRQRDALLLAAGWQVLRVTWRQLVDRPGEVLAAIRGAATRANPPILVR